MHEYKGLRIKYWRKNDQTAWILDDMAKGKPVCVGIVVSQEKIKKVEILSAQGQWGSLVKNENFTGQFENAASDENNRLTKSIDGISGATTTSVPYMVPADRSSKKLVRSYRLEMLPALPLLLMETFLIEVCFKDSRLKSVK